MEHTNKDATQDFSSRPADTMEGMKNKAQDVASSAAAKVSDATHRVGAQIEALGTKVRESAPQEGALATAATSVAQTLEGAGTYLQEKGFENMLEDLTSIVRRYPMQSLLLGVGLGYLLARSTERARL